MHHSPPNGGLNSFDMVKVTYNDPYDELEKLVLTRQVLQLRYDQLDMMTREGAMDDSPILTLTISVSHSLVKSTHRTIIKKTLKYLFKQYHRRIVRIETQIQECSQKINQIQP